MRIVFHDQEVGLLLFSAVQLYLTIFEGPDNIEIKEQLRKKVIKLDSSFSRKETGKLTYFSKDNNGNDLFLLARKNEEKIVCQTLMSLAYIFDSSNQYTYFNLTLYRNHYINWAQFLNRFSPLKGLAVTIFFYGLSKNISRLSTDIANLVKRLKK